MSSRSNFCDSSHIPGRNQPPQDGFRGRERYPELARGLGRIEHHILLFEAGGEVADHLIDRGRGGPYLTYNIFRWYNSSWGRYTQPDPIGLQAGPNLYDYVEGNPINLIDPFGLISQSELDEMDCCKLVLEIIKATNDLRNRLRDQGDPIRGVRQRRSDTGATMLATSV